MIRNRILELLRWAGNFPDYIVPAREELQIAREAQTLLET
jgi:hypothetical protein